MSLKEFEKVAIPLAVGIGMLFLVWKFSPRTCAENAMFYTKNTGLDCNQSPSM